MSSAARALPSGRTRAGVVAIARDRVWALSLWLAMLGWTAVLFVVVRDAFLSFRLGRLDLGNMVQAVWSTTQGRPLEVTHGASGEQGVRLSGHVDPFLALLAPVWAVWPSPLALAFAQIAVVSLGALPVFWLARRHLESERTAALLAFGYLAYPWIATSAVAAIHPVTFAIPLLLFCVWFLDTDRLLPFAACAVVAMSTGELMGVPVAALGIWYATARGRRRAGGAIALGGAAWTLVAVYLIVPAFRSGSNIFYGFYDEVGGSPGGVLRTLVTNPLAILAALFEPHDVVYVLWLGIPLLGLFVLSPGVALIGLPQLLANTLSDFRSMSDPRYHSVAAVIPFLIAATVFGITRISKPRRPLAAAGVLVASAMIALVVGPWPRAVGMTPLGGRETIAASREQALREAVALVPDDAPVSASNLVGAHLSARRYVYSVPVLGRAEWVVVDTSEPWVVTPDSPILTQDLEAVAELAARLDRDTSWSRVFERDGVVVFRKVPAE